MKHLTEISVKCQLLGTAGIKAFTPFHAGNFI